MKIGDLVICSNNTLWLIFEKSDCCKYLYVMDPYDSNRSEYISISDIIYHESKPANVEWLCLKKRQKNLKGLERYV